MPGHRDTRDFVQLGRQAVLDETPHAGLALCSPHLRQRDVGAVVRALIQLAERYPSGLGEYDVIYR